MARKLKVFRTPIGFHDAYVAAPSQKAALEAWGSDANLFAQGIAEQVTEPASMKAALARPGEVVRVARGSTGEHLKAAGKGGRKPSRRSKGETKEPSRRQLEQAEDRLKELEKTHKAALRALDREQAALERRRRDIERRHESERDEAAAQRDRAKRAYDRATRAWEKG